MPRRIQEDHQKFRDVYSGRIRKEIKKLINNGSIFKNRGKNGKIKITVPRIDIPHIVYGSDGTGVGRGPAKPGDLLKKPNKGQGQGASNEGSGDGVDINIELDHILKFMSDELKLPEMKKKPNQTYEEIKIKYNNISRKGPESLRHMRKTMITAMKRLAASGESDKENVLIGFDDPVKTISIINDDKRYRQYNEIKVPSTNAAIFIARDGSGSMDERKCDIVSSMAWWIDVWIRSFYEKTERAYIWHDTVAHEVSEKQFYSKRYGGGTMCSSAFDLINNIIETRYPPEMWNIYILYFGDGDNFQEDNAKVKEIIEKDLNHKKINMIAISDILPYRESSTLARYLEGNLTGQPEGFLKTTVLNDVDKGDFRQTSSVDGVDEEMIKKGIIDILGGSKTMKSKIIDREEILI